MSTEEAADMERDYEMSDLTPDRIVKLLLKHGEKVSLEEAKLIQESMKIFVAIAISQYLGVN
ncbi:hypothetical protein L0663_17350 [Dyadobacter sp. CY107]|uniref:hypothetical protein n=1 Tax=Dyadobacter fanqingshengii TaxID=2906443 RepID=UPI001F340396|nr:hypothetical protein [Dyadobacter fanqingshengii]MCF2505166.1 hypothetical protein [Dyadobacter fanqingshengii]